MVDKETILQTFKIFYLIMSYPPTPMKSWALLPMKQYVLLHKKELIYQYSNTHGWKNQNSHFISHNTEQKCYMPLSPQVTAF